MNINETALIGKYNAITGAEWFQLKGINELIKYKINFN
ncbi:hypothetical protein M993_02952 [Obesumbacterium proteus ATCC 12841]|uniref:Uncharacterized protein n=1 Tax=Obesumbacterium proteus ATCC 12841 TaxID=1354268 RepID=A0AA91IP38_9GAMM|nr:hypothetical protein M993_02952 [Obesumbacterium proteus ATCC 12841]